MIIKTTKKFSVVCAAIMVGAVLLFNSPQKTFAYDNDTHFWLTYYLAVKSGYTPMQAEQIASANISVDFDFDTTPVFPRPRFGDWRRLNAHLSFVRKSYHALASKTDVNALANVETIYWWDPTIEQDENIQKIANDIVVSGRNHLWNKTLEEKRNPGFFLHYLQDMYSHRNFKSFVGHAGYYRVDFLASDREKAREMALETIRYLYAFREYYSNRKTLEEISDASALSISDILTETDVEEIYQTIEKLADANNSDAMQANDLITRWSNLSENQKRSASNLPPKNFYAALIRAAREGQAPDSSKARDIIISITKPSQTPLMWRYDYNKDGIWKIEDKMSAQKARRYKNIITHSENFTAAKEIKNMEDREIFDENVNPKRKQCLPFTLVDDAQAKIPYCN